MREKEKEIAKLRSEIGAFKKIDSNANNGKGGESTTKEQADSSAQVK